MATSPLASRWPRIGRNCYVTHAFPGVLNAKRGEYIASGYLTAAFSGHQKRAELLRNPYILWGPTMGTKSEVDASPLPLQGSRTGRNCYVTPAFAGVPDIGGKNQKWLAHP